MKKHFQDYRLSAALPGRNPVRWLVGTGILAIAAIVIATAMAISGFRDNALASTQRELENALVLLTRHFEQDFGDLQRIQKSVTAYLQATGIESTEEFARRMSSIESHKMLKATVSDASTGSVSLFSADGYLISRTTVWPAPRIYVGDRSYFQKLKENTADADEEIVEPLVSRVTGGWLTTFARRLSGPNGEFLGVLSRQISPEQFEPYFTSISLGKNASISMLHANRTLIARYPQAKELIGKTFPPNGVFRNVKRATPSTLITVSPIDGLQRITSVWQLENFPIVLLATVSVDSALTQWRRQTRLIVIAAALAALVVGGLLFLVTRQVARQHRAAKQRLMLEMSRLDTAINNLSQGVMLYDADARAVVVSRTYLSMYGMPAEVIKPGCTIHEVMTQHKADGAFEGDVDAYCGRILEAVKTAHAFTQHLPDGRVVRIQSLPIEDGGWVVSHEEITERHRVEERISRLAHYDPLTDLPNRTLFRDLLSRELALIGRGRRCAVLYIDMDEFKGINDSLGHSVGDALLRAMGLRLKSCVRSGDVVARLGGDEFSIVHTDLQSEADVIDLVTRIYTAIRAPYECHGHILFIDASIGIAMAPRDGRDLDALLKNADLAMYSAKADGRRTYRFFEPAMDARVQAQRVLENDLRHAVAHGFDAGGFEVFYQPLLRLDDDTISGCEALLRWRHPVRGMISPAEFIPVAESIGVINELGEWVLRTACAVATSWPDDIKIAVNISPVQFRDPALVPKIVAALADCGLSPPRLELEITEAVLIRDDDVALAILHRLRELGVRIALDDFGTGYSSLSYLQRFPFDKIKIDRCFVTDIAEPDGSSAIVQAVVNIAASRHMTTAAEGVETEQQKGLLRALGCTQMQGYLFSAARPAAEVRQLIEAHGPSAAAA